LFFVYLCIPLHLFAAECRDPSKIVIGFIILFAGVLLLICIFGLLSSLLISGTKHIKAWTIFIVVSLFLGLFGLVAGFIKEQNNNSDRIPFLSAKDCGS